MRRHSLLERKAKVMSDDQGSPITEDWLRSVGFKWHEIERSPSKHWLLWIMGASLEVERKHKSGLFGYSSEDLGLELTENRPGEDWFCWIRADYCGRYTRIIHVRNLHAQSELVTLIEALTGRPFVAADALYGSLRSPQEADRLRQDAERLDQHAAREWGKRVERELKLDPDERGPIKR